MRRRRRRLGDADSVTDFWLQVLASVVGGALVAAVLIAAGRKVTST